MFFVAALLVTASAAATAAVASVGPAPAADVGILANVDVAVFNFAPAVVVVPAGSTVTWHFVESLIGYHTITTGSILNPTPVPDCPTINTQCGADAFNVKITGPVGVPTLSGSTFSHTFSTSGVYTYFCIPHYPLGMRGIVVVQ